MKNAERRFSALGTVCRIRIQAHDADHLLAAAINLVHHGERIFSLHREDSELSCLNRSAGSAASPVSDELFELIRIGKAASLEESSQLNIALAPLIKTWNIGFPDAQEPSPQLIEALLPLCQAENIMLDPYLRTVHLPQKGMALDLGALAKGAIADKVLTYLKAAGAVSVLLDFGGNVLVQGQSTADVPVWQVGIQKPHAPRGQLIGHVKLADQSLVTSGVYERVLMVNGRAYHHILDRKTGYPMVTDVLGVTILADTALTAEIWTSKLFGLPSQQILDKINQDAMIEGLVLTRDNRCLLSTGMVERFTPQYH